jgi:signal transduction histidine kinase
MNKALSFVIKFYHQIENLGINENLTYREKREIIALNNVNLGIIVLLFFLIIINFLGGNYFAAGVEILAVIFGCFPYFYFQNKSKFQIAKNILFSLTIVSCVSIALVAVLNHRKVNTEFVLFGIALSSVLYYDGWKKKTAYTACVIFYFSIRSIKFLTWDERTGSDFTFEIINASVVFFTIYLISNLYKMYFQHYERELTKSNKELSELNAQKNKMFAIIAHDLRAPLGNVNQILAMAAEGNLTNTEIEQTLEKLSSNAYATSELLDNLLNWASSQMKGAAVKKINFDLMSSVQRKILLFWQMSKQKGVYLENKIQNEIFVYADINMIDTVLRNLVSNAVKFCRQGDSISISAESDNNMIKVCVADTGIGITEEHQKLIFDDITFTVRGTANEKGTGLGLPLCKDFVERNGGNIWVESSFGKGSRFYFTLPSGSVN